MAEDTVDATAAMEKMSLEEATGRSGVHRDVEATGFIRVEKGWYRGVEATGFIRV